MLYLYQPLSLSMKLTFSWIKESEPHLVTNFTELETAKLHVGDIIQAKGVGMCYMPPNLSSKNNKTIFLHLLIVRAFIGTTATQCQCLSLVRLKKRQHYYIWLKSSYTPFLTTV